MTYSLTTVIQLSSLISESYIKNIPNQNDGSFMGYYYLTWKKRRKEYAIFFLFHLKFNEFDGDYND